MESTIQKGSKSVASFPAAAADPDLAARLLSSAAERSEPILLPQLVAGGEQHTPGHAASYAPAPHHGSCAWPALRLWQGTDGLQHMARAVGDAPVQVMLSRGPVFHGDIGRHTPATTTFNQLAHMLAAAAAAAGTGGAAAEEAPVPPPRPTAAGALGARVEVAKEAHGAAPGGSTAAGAGAGGAAAAVSACYTRGRVDHMSSSTTTTSSSTSGEGGDSGDSGEDTIGSSSGDDSSDGGGRATEACGNHRGDRVGGSMGAGASAAAGPGGSTAGPGGPGAPGGLRVYLAQQPLAGALSPLLRDVPLPGCLAALGRDMAHVNLWMCGGLVRSSLHLDPHHNLLVLVAGTKRVRLIPPLLTPCVYPMTITGDAPNHSQVDFAAPDLTGAHPAYAAALAASRVAELKAGDALFIPEGWWHQVDSGPELTIAVNYWWRSDLADALAHTTTATATAGPPALDRLTSAPPPPPPAAPAAAEGTTAEQATPGQATAKQLSASPAAFAGKLSERQASQSPTCGTQRAAADAACIQAPPSPLHVGLGLRHVFTLRQLARSAVDDVAELLLSGLSGGGEGPAAGGPAWEELVGVHGTWPVRGDGGSGRDGGGRRHHGAGSTDLGAGGGVPGGGTGGGGSVGAAGGRRDDLAEVVVQLEAALRIVSAVEGGQPPLPPPPDQQQEPPGAHQVQMVPTPSNVHGGATSGGVLVALPEGEAGGEDARLLAWGLLRLLPPGEAAALGLVGCRLAQRLAAAAAACPGGAQRLVAALRHMALTAPSAAAALLLQGCRVPSVACVLTRAFDRLAEEQEQQQKRRQEQLVQQPQLQQQQHAVQGEDGGLERRQGEREAAGVSGGVGDQGHEECSGHEAGKGDGKEAGGTAPPAKRPRLERTAGGFGAMAEPCWGSGEGGDMAGRDEEDGSGDGVGVDGGGKGGDGDGGGEGGDDMGSFFELLYGTVEDPDQVFRLLLAGREALNRAARRLLVETILA